MLTARTSEFDRVLGLELGADDYLTKPFSVLELVARVKALFRRMEALASQDEHWPRAPLRLGDLSIEPDKRRVEVRGEAVQLTAKEFDLLLHFARYPGRVFTRAQLLDQVWGYGHEGYEHTVNSHINRLRSKIEQDPAQPRYILTVWGIGYRFSEPGTRGARVMMRTLYGRLAAALLAILILVGGLFFVAGLASVRHFLDEVHQKLNRDLAEHLVADSLPMENGEIRAEELEHIFHVLMVINPSIEVYLLDPEGEILAYSAPKGIVVRDRRGPGPDPSISGSGLPSADSR